MPDLPSPSPQLLALLNNQVSRLRADAQQQSIAARTLAAKGNELIAIHTAEQTALADDEATLAALRQKIDDRKNALAERAQQIADHMKRVNEHKANAQQFTTDAEYLKQQLGATEPEAAEATGPQPAAPVTPAETAQLANSGDAPECMTCHGPIQKDQLSWYHESTRTIYCYEGSGASVLRVPAALEISTVIA